MGNTKSRRETYVNKKKRWRSSQKLTPNKEIVAPPKRPVRMLLSIDGGAMGGHSQLIFLSKLEEKCGFPLRDLFDFVAGCSVGAILAGGICFNENLHHRHVSEELNLRPVFEKVFSGKSFNSYDSPKFSGEGKTKFLSEVLPDIVVSKPPFNNLVMIPLVDGVTGGAVFMKSYDPSDPLKNCSIRQIVDASSAAPFYFPSVRIDGALPSPEDDHVIINGIDGGLFACNPCEDAYLDFDLLCPNTEIRVVSIGVGKLYGGTEHSQLDPNETKNWGIIEWMREGDLTERIFEFPKDMTHERMLRNVRANKHRYIRVDDWNEFKQTSTDENNWNLLTAFGEHLWNKFGDLVYKLLKPRIEELKLKKQWKRKLNPKYLKKIDRNENFYAF